MSRTSEPLPAFVETRSTNRTKAILRLRGTSLRYRRPLPGSHPIWSKSASGLAHVGTYFETIHGDILVIRGRACLSRIRNRICQRLQVRPIHCATLADTQSELFV